MRGGVCYQCVVASVCCACVVGAVAVLCCPHATRHIARWEFRAGAVARRRRWRAERLGHVRWDARAGLGSRNSTSNIQECYTLQVYVCLLSP